METLNHSINPELHYSNIYEYDYSEGLGFRFETKDKVQYLVAIGHYRHNNEDYGIRILSFRKFENGIKTKYDLKVKSTICAIIKHYLSIKPNDVLVYYCMDGEARSRLYNAWAKSHQNDTDLYFHSSYFIMHQRKNYFGIIASKSSLFLDHAIEYVKTISMKEITELK
jgi:hypothetical protein